MKEDTGQEDICLEGKNALTTNIPVKWATLEAVITRADGTVEDLGVIAGTHRNPIIHYWMQLSIWFRGLIRKYGYGSH